MKNKGYNIYFVFIVVAILLVILAFIFTPAAPTDSKVREIVPIEVLEKTEYEKHYIFDISEINTGHKDLMFFSKHTYIKVYADDNLIYECTENGGIWGHTTGALWNFVGIPYGSKEIEVVCTAAYDVVKDLEIEFLIGDKLAMFQDIYTESVPALLVSILIIIFGIVLIMYWMFLIKKFDIGKGMLFLGIFATLMGMYLLNETDATIIGIRHRTASLMITYVILIALIPTCILLVKEFVGLIENTVWKLLVGVSMAELVICITLQFMNVMDMRETLFITHILICITAIYIVINFIIKLWSKDKHPMLKVSFWGMMVLAVSLAANLISYYLNISASDTGVYGRAGFLLFVLILSRESVNNTIDLMERGRKAEVYVELATKDMLTGLNNRNAYMQDIENTKKYNNVMLITFDLNNLKQCNDSEGHTEGDNYILGASKIINEVFSTYGSCYRIGGDEFCVIIKNADKCPIEQLIALMKEKEKNINRDNRTYDMYISYGYAMYNGEKDSDLEATRDRADALMYENKRMSKL